MPWVDGGVSVEPMGSAVMVPRMSDAVLAAGWEMLAGAMACGVDEEMLVAMASG